LTVHHCCSVLSDKKNIYINDYLFLQKIKKQKRTA
jgi:hypothetical protein